MNTKLVAVDVGYIGLKFFKNPWASDQDERNMVTVPSFVRRLDVDDEPSGPVLEWEDNRYLVGEIARESKDSNFTPAPRAQDIDTYVLLQYAMAQICDPDDNVFVVTGLPDKEYPIYKDEFKKRIARLGHFTWNGIEYNLTVEAVQIIKQSMGAFFSVSIDGEGNEMAGFEDMKIGIIEWGWRTMFTTQIAHMEYMKDYSKTHELGMYHIANSLTEKIYERYQIDYHPEQLEEAIITGTIPLYGSDEDITDLLEEAFSEAVEKALEAIGRTWPNLARLNGVLFGGGSVQPIYDCHFATRREFANNSRLLDRLAVARGYRRLGLALMGGVPDATGQPA